MGVKPLDILISSINKERIIEDIEGMNGGIDYGFVYKDREVNLEFLLQPSDTQDYRLIRNAMYVLLDKVAYISESYIMGKRYRVKVDDNYIPERAEGNQRWALADVNCSNFELPFAESVASSMTIHNKGINAESNFWSYGMGIIEEPASRLYKHTGNHFKIYNMGDVKINHYNFDFEIKITNVKGSVNSFELINRTNGTVFKIKNKVNQGDVIEIKKGQVLRNTANYMRNTTRTFIELEPGYNEFEIRGATSATVEFDFKAYYL